MLIIVITLTYLSGVVFFTKIWSTKLWTEYAIMRAAARSIYSAYIGLMVLGPEGAVIWAQNKKNIYPIILTIP